MHKRLSSGYYTAIHFRLALLPCPAVPCPRPPGWHHVHVARMDGTLVGLRISIYRNGRLRRATKTTKTAAEIVPHYPHSPKVCKHEANRGDQLESTVPRQRTDNQTENSHLDSTVEYRGVVFDAKAGRRGRMFLWGLGFSFGGPGEIRTHDLFHAMERKSITYRQFHQKQKTYRRAIWTPVDAKTPVSEVVDSAWTPYGLHTGAPLARGCHRLSDFLWWRRSASSIQDAARQYVKA